MNTTWKDPDGKEAKTAYGQRKGQRYSGEVTYGVDEHTSRMIFLKEEAKKAGIELHLELLDPSAAYKKEMENKHTD